MAKVSHWHRKGGAVKGNVRHIHDDGGKAHQHGYHGWPGNLWSYGRTQDSLMSNIQSSGPFSRGGGVLPVLPLVAPAKRKGK